MTLKTLKDIDSEKYIGKYCFKTNSFKKRIKQEAIKWIYGNEDITLYEDTKDWIKHFFNITEEDLQ